MGSVNRMFPVYRFKTSGAYRYKTVFGNGLLKNFVPKNREGGAKAMIT